MGCILSKKSKPDIYKIVSDTAAGLKNTVEQGKKRESIKSSSPTSREGRTRAESFYSYNEGPTTTKSSIKSSRGSIFGSSIFNFRTNKSPDVVYEDVDPLYVILPYFNYCRFKRRRELFIEFYNRIKDNPRIRIVICEAALTGHEHELPRDLPNVFTHIHVYTRHQLWIKENLVNIAVRRLPPHWKYMAWIDADITFVDEEWVEKTIERFDKYDVLQLFSSIVYLGPNNEAMKTDKSFGYMYRRSGKQYTQTYRYGFWHPGFAWGCTKNAYNTMGGLIDFGILGSGDHHMALGLISKIECSHPKNIHPEYRQLLKDFEKRVKSLRLGYIEGTIMHHWHGDLKLRRYKERWQILTDHQYDPTADVSKDPLGLYQFTESGDRMEKDIQDYFAGRMEDDTRVMS